MAHTILFKREGTYNVDPLMDKIRVAARAEGWSRMVGFKDWAKENYNATLRAGKYDDWTSISFNTEQNMIKFKQDFGVEK